MESPYQIVKERLLTILRTEHFENNKLYSEEELVRILDASRSTVREALRSLENDGIISKKHGVGTFVHPKVLAMNMRFDQNLDFMKMIEDEGYQAGLLRDGDPQIGPCPQDILEGVGRFLNQEEEYYSFRRIYTADGKPAAYCTMYFPNRAFHALPPGQVEFVNIFGFTEKYFQRATDHELISFSARCAEGVMAQKLQVEPGTALLVWDELLCDYQDNVLGFSRIYFTPSMASLSILRQTK